MWNDVLNTQNAKCGTVLLQGKLINIAESPASRHTSLFSYLK